MTDTKTRRSASYQRALRVGAFFRKQGAMVEKPTREGDKWTFAIMAPGGIDHEVEIKDNGYERVRHISKHPNDELTREVFYTVLKIK